MKHKLFKKQYLALLLSVLSIFFLYSNLHYWERIFVNGAIMVLFLLVQTYFFDRILLLVFAVRSRYWERSLLAFFAAFLSLTLTAAIFITFSRISPDTQVAAYSFSFLINYLIFNYARDLKKVGLKKKPVRQLTSSLVIFDQSWYVSLLFVILLFIAFVLLVGSAGSIQVLWSPWQVISPFYLPFFFILVFLLGILIFSRSRIKIVLFFLVLLSILCHSYLALSHQMPWGGDVWRMVAVEEKLLDGDYYPPVLHGHEARWTEAAGIDLPEVFTVPQKFTYAHYWAVNVLVAGGFNLDLATVSKWLVPLLWSVFGTMFLFRIGHLIFRNWRMGLLLAWLGLLPFTFQVLGAISLPVSLGFVVFLFVMCLWLQYFQDQAPGQLLPAAIFTFLMLFGYSLHFLLLFFSVPVVFVYGLIARAKKKALLIPAKIILLLGAPLFFPAIELSAKISRLPEQYDLVLSAKKALAIFSGWYYASGIRSHDILMGNIFFNHTPNYAFVENFFTGIRWIVIPLMLIICLCFLLELMNAVIKKNDKYWFFVTFLAFMSFGAYLIGWFYLEGDRLFTRRLDHVLALIILIFFLSFVGASFNKLSTRFLNPVVVKVYTIILVVIFSLLGVIAYGSGPDMRVVSDKEYQAARIILQNISTTSNNHCIIADTWLLLLIEAQSHAKIAGGGFPMDYQFAQPERMRIYDEIAEGNLVQGLNRAFHLTGADQCFVAIDNGAYQDGIMDVEPLYTDEYVILRFSDKEI